MIPQKLFTIVGSGRLKCRLTQRHSLKVGSMEKLIDCCYRVI